MTVHSSDSAERSRATNSAMLRDGGRVSLTRRGTSVVCRMVGTLETSHTTWMLGELDRALADGARTIFIDASQMQQWDPSERFRFETWGGDHRRALAAIHMLGDSPEVFAELAQVREHLGPMVRCYDKPAPFFDRLQDQSDQAVPTGDGSPAPA